MKVLLVNTYHYHRGGDCTYTFSLAEALRAHGSEVFFFGMKHPLNYPCPQEAYFVDNIDFTEAHSHRNVAMALKVLSRSIYSIHARTNIARLLDDLKPDIAHLQNIHAHLTPSILFELRRRNVPIVWTLHDYKIICPNTTLLSHGDVCERCKPDRFYNVMLRRCKKGSLAASTVAGLESYAHRLMKVYTLPAKYISPSRFLMEKFLEFGFDKNMVTHLPYCLSVGPLKPALAEGGYCVYAGRLSEEKGLMTLLQAMKVAEHVKLIVVGDGNLRSQLGDFLVRESITNVTLAGYKSAGEVQSLIGNAMFCIAPSEWYENYPYAVMEAMAGGKPVIASNIGGLPELIEDGLNGFLVDPQDHVALADRIRSLAADKHLRQRMGKIAFEKAQMIFDPESHYQRLLSIYHTCMG